MHDEVLGVLNGYEPSSMINKVKLHEAPNDANDDHNFMDSRDATNLGSRFWGTGWSDRCFADQRLQIWGLKPTNMKNQ